MKKLVLGSLNIDRTYRVSDFVRPKETIAAKDYACFCGGKGFNQAVALARAGSEVWFAGVLGSDGGMLLRGLEDEGIRTDLLRRSEGPNGHAVIQVNDRGENCIMIVAGSNGEVDRTYIDQALSRFGAGDLVVLQNEIPHVDYAIARARELGLAVAFNPSPFNGAIASCDLSLVSYLLINEVEGAALTGRDVPEEILDAAAERYPDTAVVLTLGGDGAWALLPGQGRWYAPAVPCDCVDTTAAGDTFTGYFLTELLGGGDGPSALRWAAMASSIAVSRQGASVSVPRRAEVAARLEEGR